MPKRVAPLCLLAVALSTGVTVATAAPAAAQGGALPGWGATFLFDGAHTRDGTSIERISFGNPADTFYLGDWYGTGVDLPMVRRGNAYFVPGAQDPGATADVFRYGNADDQVLVGDWDGDGVDTLAVRRGNHYFVKNDNRTTGVADTEFFYGDPYDVVLVGNWDGRRTPAGAGVVGKGDTLLVRRGGQYFVKNDLVTGVAESTFFFGDPYDEILVGDWEGSEVNSDHIQRQVSGDGADQLAVRRGPRLLLSSEVAAAGRDRTNPVVVTTFYAYYPGDTVVVGSSYRTVIDNTRYPSSDGREPTQVIRADYFGLRAR